MYTLMVSVTSVIAAAILFGLFWKLTKELGTTPNRLPPGPRFLPIIGNVHQLPVSNQHEIFFDWGQKYGDLIYARLFQTPVVITNSIQVARDLMEKRGSNFSDRPDFILFNELMGWGAVLTHLPYGEKFRKQRKWFQAAFQAKTALHAYQALQRRETYILLAGLTDSSEAFRSHLKRYAAAIIVEIAYGHTVSGLEDEYIEIADRATTETVTAGTPGTSILGLLVDFFPILKHYPIWLPGSGFKIRTNEVRRLVNRLFDAPYRMVTERMASGTGHPSFTSNLLEEYRSGGYLSPDDEVDIKAAAAALYGAGTDTTATVLTAFFLAMVCNPESFQKAQQEMDRVVGSDRLPDFDDRESLPYLECVMKELYRWAAPVPLGIPHRSVTVDEYRGYTIPAGAMIIPNIWGMFRDKRMYPHPERFIPERFAGCGNFTADTVDPRQAAFGFGRRQCPGQQLADGSVFLAMANIVATMYVSPLQDDKGDKIIPPAEFFSGMVRHPKPFECSIKPRSQKAVDLIVLANALL